MCVWLETRRKKDHVNSRSCVCCASTEQIRMLMRGNSSDSETYLKARVTSSVQTKCSPRLRNAKKDRSRSVALNSPCVRVGGLREVQACSLSSAALGLFWHKSRSSHRRPQETFHPSEWFGNVDKVIGGRGLTEPHTRPPDARRAQTQTPQRHVKYQTWI